MSSSGHAARSIALGVKQEAHHDQMASRMRKKLDGGEIVLEHEQGDGGDHGTRCVTKQVGG